MGDPLRLYGLNALVLTAASGIGEAIARTLVKHGASVIAADSANSGVERQFSRVKGITGITARMTDVDAMQPLVASAAEKLGGVDIVVNEFPLQPDEPLEQAGAQLDSLLQSRTVLTRAVCRAAVPILKKGPQGRIINIGFLRSCFAESGESACASAERDLRSLTRSIAAETSEFGINTNYIQPGAIMTPVSREVFRKHPSLRDYCINASSARRLGEPIDVAKVALFLASEDAEFVNGAGITVDGGRAGVDG
ncbi:MAG: SDR family oxidoreductase [Gammaproteobacteria bacterium]|nr:SDR family oxidoreductase [Gammaproteobacteria bacterium]